MPDDPVERRRRGVAIAGHTGDAVLAREALSDPDPSVRATAVGALARLGELTVAELEVALEDDEPDVRRRALEVSTTFPGHQAPSVLPLLDDHDPVVAETAAWACGERTPPEAGAASALAAVATGHPEHLVREAAVAAIGAVGDPVALPAVLAAFDERATIRRRAVIALAAFDGPEVDEALRRAVGDRDRQVRQTAEDLLG